MNEIVFENFNPATGQKIGTWNYKTQAEVDQSLKKLTLGFNQWKNIDVKKRQKLLGKVIEQFELKKALFIEATTRSMGKPISQSELEFDKSVQAAKYLCQQEIKALEPIIIQDKIKTHQIVKFPMGIILGIMPWNFPIWQSIRMIFPTLIAGNSVLLKHSEITFEIGELIKNSFYEAGLDFFIFDHQLFPVELSEKILGDAQVAGVSLTGSIRAGKAVAEIAGRHLKKGVFELGGSDPSLVFEDCDVELAAKSIVRSRFLNSGQVCIATKRILVERPLVAKFIEATLIQFKKLVPDDPMIRHCQIGPLAHVRFQKEYNKQISELNDFSEVIAENKPRIQVESEKSAFVTPKILLFKKQIDFFALNEIFAPALCVIPFDLENEALQLANATQFALGASVYTQDFQRASRIASELIAGQVVVNSFVTSDVRLPFGGFKNSGYGRELGEEGFSEFTQSKVITRFDAN